MKKRYLKGILSIVMAFLMVVIPNITVFASGNNSEFQILNGDYDNELIVIEDGEKSIIRYGYESGRFKVKLYDDNNNLIEVYEDPSAELDMENSNFFNNIGESIYRAGGNGTRENPYMYCTPGGSRTTSSRISYGQIIGMIGSTITAASITSALIVIIKSGIGATISSSALKNLSNDIAPILIANNSAWLNSHGINLRFRLTCSLQNHKDGAWNEDIWFYGELASLTSYSRY